MNSIYFRLLAWIKATTQCNNIPKIIHPTYSSLGKQSNRASKTHFSSLVPNGNPLNHETNKVSRSQRHAFVNIITFIPYPYSFRVHK